MQLVRWAARHTRAPNPINSVSTVLASQPRSVTTATAIPGMRQHEHGAQALLGACMQMLSWETG
jgi:hypothetical protein